MLIARILPLDTHKAVAMGGHSVKRVWVVEVGLDSGRSYH